MAKKARQLEQRKRSKPPQKCRELAGGVPCERPAGHPGGHLAIVRHSAEEILAGELRQLRLALSRPPWGLVAKADRWKARQQAAPTTIARSGLTDEILAEMMTEFQKKKPRTTRNTKHWVAWLKTTRGVTIKPNGLNRRITKYLRDHPTP